MKRCAVILILILLLVTVSFAGKPKAHPTLVKLDPQTEQIDDLKLDEPKQPCPNWAWASIMEAALARQNVALDQAQLILKADGGEVCIHKAVDLAEIKKTLDGIYVQPDGSKVEVEAVITPGTPQDVGYLIRCVREKRPLLLLWLGHPVVLEAVEFDEYIYPNDQRMYEARKLTFLDPATEKLVIFDKAKDDPSELGGVLEVRVGPVQHFK